MATGSDVTLEVLSSIVNATMWHEARRQERRIKGMLIDYKKRAERRKEYYERIKLDPTQFLQIHGRPCKIHLDPSIANAAEAPGSMMPWHGDTNSMIDRFDVRAHLDSIPPISAAASVPSSEEDWEERQANYERYRIVVQNDFMAIREEKFLHQVRLEEQFGPLVNRSQEEEKKALAPKKAAIGFIYEDDGPSLPPLPISGGGRELAPPPPPGEEVDKNDENEGGSDEEEEESDEEIDLDLTVDVLCLTNEQQQEMNAAGTEYGLQPDDFMKLISQDLQEAEDLRVARQQEDEKAMFTGRKSRKERRALKMKQLERKISPPSYAARTSPVRAPPSHRSSSGSCSPTPTPTGQIKFITSFGGDSDDEGATGVAKKVISPTGPLPSKSRLPGDRRDRSRYEDERRPTNRHRGSGSPSYRRASRNSPPSSVSRKSRRVSHSRSRSRSSSHRRGKSRYSRSRSRGRRTYHSKSRSRSRNRDRHSKKRNGNQNRSASHSRNQPDSRSRSRSARKITVSPVKEQPSIPHIRKSTTPPTKLPSPPRRSYYGRRGHGSDSDGEFGSDGAEEVAAKKPSPLNLAELMLTPTLLLPTAGPANKGLLKGAAVGYVTAPMVASCTNNETSSSKASHLSHQERLRKKMQALLKKQFKEDKRMEREKAEKAEQERLEREEELRELAIRMRRKERERRHQLTGEDSSLDSSGSRSGSNSPHSRISRSISKSGSRSPLSTKQNSKGRSERTSRSRDRKSSTPPRTSARIRGSPQSERRGRGSPQSERRGRGSPPLQRRARGSPQCDRDSRRNSTDRKRESRRRSRSRERDRSRERSRDSRSFRRDKKSSPLPRRDRAKVGKYSDDEENGGGRIGRIRLVDY